MHQAARAPGAPPRAGALIAVARHYPRSACMMPKPPCTVVLVSIFAGQLLLMPHCTATAPVNADSEATSAAAVACKARTMLGSTALADALPMVRLPPGSARNARQVLEGLGFRNALDLQLLGGGPEADALMAALEKQEEGPRLSIGSRAKIRLLVGDGAHLDRVSSGGGCGSVSGAEQDRSGQVEAGKALHGVASQLLRGTSRLLQESPTGKQEVKTGGMSADTIAIALSVLVGAIGYLVQAYTARRAEVAAAEQSQELHFAEQTRQREQQVLLAQIQRTDRV